MRPSAHAPVFHRKIRYGQIRAGAQVGLTKNANISATTVTATVAVPAAMVSTGVAIAATTFTATASTLAPIVSVGSNANVSANAVTITATTIAPTVTTTSDDTTDDELTDTIGIAFDDPDFPS